MSSYIEQLEADNELLRKKLEILDQLEDTLKEYKIYEEVVEMMAKTCEGIKCEHNNGTKYFIELKIGSTEESDHYFKLMETFIDYYKRYYKKDQET